MNEYGFVFDCVQNISFYVFKLKIYIPRKVCFELLLSTL